MIGKLVLAAGAVVALGLTFGRDRLVYGPEAARIRRQFEEHLRRLPLPHIQLHLPQTADEIAGFDDALCECVDQAGLADAIPDDVVAGIDGVRGCAAAMLFPDVEWPPVPSDHVSIHQVWSVLDHRLRTLAYSGQLAAVCAASAEGADGAESAVVSDFQPRTAALGSQALVRVVGSGFSAETTFELVTEDGTSLQTQIQSASANLVELVVQATPEGTYDLVVRDRGVETTYPDALVVRPEQAQ